MKSSNIYLYNLLKYSCSLDFDGWHLVLRICGFKNQILHLFPLQIYKIVDNNEKLISTIKSHSYSGNICWINILSHDSDNSTAFFIVKDKQNRILILQNITFSW